MVESIVKVPQCAADDMDFLAFSFNGKHSWDDFGIYRTIDGDRYSENFAPTLNDKTAEVPGGDGMYYFGSTHKQRDFNISFAFDHLKEAQLREMKKWLNGKEMGDLWFSEAPYKVWTAKPSGNSAIKYIPFDDEDGQRVYKGEGTVQFTAYWPYAHTPDFVATYYDIIINNSPEYYELKNSLLLNKNSKIWVWEEDIGYVTNCGLEYGDVNGNYSSFSFNKDYYVFNDHDNITITQLGFTRPLSCQIYTGELGNLTPIELKDLTSIARNLNGLLLSSYNQFGNKDQWAPSSGLTNTFTPGDNNGDLPTPFVLKQDGFIPSGTIFTVGEAEITTTSDCYNLEWDSKAGLVIAGNSATITDKKDKKPISILGYTCAEIPVGGVNVINGEIDNTTTRTTIEKIEKSYSEWEKGSEVKGVTKIDTKQTEITETKTNTYTGWYIGNTSKFGNNLPWENGIQIATSQLIDSGLSVYEISANTGFNTEHEILLLELSSDDEVFQSRVSRTQDYKKEEETNTEEQVIFDSELSQRKQYQQIQKRSEGTTTITYDYNIDIARAALSFELYSADGVQELKILLNDDNTASFEIGRLDIDFDFYGPDVVEVANGKEITQVETFDATYTQNGQSVDTQIDVKIKAVLSLEGNVAVYLILTNLKIGSYDDTIQFDFYEHTIANSFAIGPMQGAASSSEVTVSETTSINKITTKTTPINVGYTRDVTEELITTKTTKYTGQFSYTDPQLTTVLITTTTKKNQAGDIVDEPITTTQEIPQTVSPLNINYHYWYY